MRHAAARRARLGTLLEALPYIREFHGTTVVIKYGGAAMDDPELREEFARDVVLLKYVGLNPVVVHGGGPDITAYMERLGLPVEFVGGLRVSDEDDGRDRARWSWSARSTRTSSCASTATGSPRSACAATTASLFRVTAARRPAARTSASSGASSASTSDVLNHIASDYIPVIASVGADREGRSHNINADEAAGAVARALGAYKVIFLTDVPGWLRDPADPDSLIAQAERRRGAGRARAAAGRHAAEARRRASTRSTAASRAAHIVDGRIAALAAARAVHRRRHRHEDRGAP